MIVLKDFTTLSDEGVWLVFTWRNMPQVAEFMHNKAVSLESHLRFLESLKCDFSKKYFLVFKDKTPIGVIDFINIKAESCEFGLYQNPLLKGYGGDLMQEVLNYAFNVLNVESLNATAFSDNTKAINLYKKFNFTLKSVKDDLSYFYLKKGGGGLKPISL